MHSGRGGPVCPPRPKSMRRRRFDSAPGLGHNSAMRQEGPGGGGRRGLGRWIAGGLLLYGAVGVAVQLRLVGGLLAGIAALAGRLDFRAAPPAVPGLDWLAGHYDALPALPWLAWLAGLLLWSRGR